MFMTYFNGDGRPTNPLDFARRRQIWTRRNTGAFPRKTFDVVSAVTELDKKYGSTLFTSSSH
jgi:hypothetical protein